MDDRIKISALAGGIAFILFQLLFNFGDSFEWWKVPLAFIIFAAVGGVAYVVQGLMNK